MTERTYTARLDTNAVIQDWDGLIIGPEHETEWADYLDWVDNGGIVNPAQQMLPVMVPQTISDRQFFQQAAIVGLLTTDEAIAAVATGTIPAVLQTIVDNIEDPAQQFGAKMLLAGATVFDRNHPLTEVVGATLGWSSTQIDDFFIAASKL
jgi:hypothetical protein